MDKLSMEHLSHNNMDNIEALWDLATMAFELENISNDNNTTDDTNCELDSICKHKIKNLNSENYLVCEECGIILSNTVCGEAEWNNFKDDCGNYQKNTQRADVYIENNPYSKGNSTSIPWANNSLIGKLHMQQTFTHKQKTYWLIGHYIDNMTSLLNISTTVSESAKNLWLKYMQSGKLTRASVRKGLICACIIHSCNNNNIPIERDDVLKICNCSSKSLSKGEKVLFDILNEKNNVYINILNSDSEHFVKYCSQLKLPWSINNICNELFIKYQVQLQAVSPKSAVGGVIAYIVKYKLKLKQPTKTVISATVDVCTPTLNKVINLIYQLDKDNLQ